MIKSVYPKNIKYFFTPPPKAHFQLLFARFPTFTVDAVEMNCQRVLLNFVLNLIGSNCTKVYVGGWVIFLLDRAPTVSSERTVI